MKLWLGTSIKEMKRIPTFGEEATMEEDTLEEMIMTKELGKEKDTTGEIVETEDKIEIGEKETGEDTRIEEIEGARPEDEASQSGLSERDRPEDEAAPGSIEEQDLDSKDQEEVNPEDREEAQWDQENNQEDREPNQGTRFTHARGS